VLYILPNSFNPRRGGEGADSLSLDDRTDVIVDAERVVTDFGGFFIDHITGDTLELSSHVLFGQGRHGIVTLLQ
jgi:hypothetical protein